MPIPPPSPTFIKQYDLLVSLQHIARAPREASTHENSAPSMRMSPRTSITDFFVNILLHVGVICSLDTESIADIYFIVSFQFILYYQSYVLSIYSKLSLIITLTIKTNMRFEEPYDIAILTVFAYFRNLICSFEASTLLMRVGVASCTVA